MSELTRRDSLESDDLSLLTPPTSLTMTSKNPVSSARNFQHSPTSPRIRDLPTPPISTSTARSSICPSPPTLSPVWTSTPPVARDEWTFSSAWSPEEDRRLIEARQKNLNWGPIAGLFSLKTANACRKRHERLMAIEQRDAAKSEAISKAYCDVREQMWQLVADRVPNEKWTDVEAKVSQSYLSPSSSFC